MDNPSEKTCRKCGETKTTDDFNWKNKKAGRLSNQCKKCMAEYHRKYGVLKRDKLREYKKQHKEEFRLYHIKYLYGLSKEAYEALLYIQNNSCAICGTTDPGRNSKVFCVDHDHEVNEVRGLLCFRCNSGLGYFKDNIDNLYKAVTYLRRMKVSQAIAG